MQWAYQQAGIQLPRTAAEQYNATKRITSQELQPGDLIFFAGTTDAPGITHVGMYIGNGQMIQAPKEGDIVKIVSINDAYWSQHTVGYGRV
jgi:cell wall-associated NlpC family hydrolase